MAINQSFSFLITSTDKHVFLHQNYDPYEVFQENMDDINKKQAVTPLCKPLVKFDWSICPSCHINFHNVLVYSPQYERYSRLPRQAQWS